MNMWSMQVIILLLFCYACLSTGNRTVYFVSKNFYNVLHWNPVTPALPGEKVLYSVWYWSDAVEQPYQIKEECENITALSCDLTAETPSVHDVHYRAQVSANGRFHGRTNTFKPIAQTILGSPILSVNTMVSSLHVDVTVPLGPNGVSIEDIITSSKNVPSKIVTVYTLKITHPKWAAQVKETTTGRFVVDLKNNQTEYCGYVVYKPHSEWGRSESEKTSFCVTLPGHPLMLLPWLFVSAALLAAIVITSVACACNYVKGGKEKFMPQDLITSFSSPPRVLQAPDGNLIISKLEIYTQSDQTVYATIQKPNVPSVVSGCYSPQEILCQTWQDSTGSSVGTGAQSPAPNSEGTSAQSSESYSVVAVHAPAEENEDNQQVTTEDRETGNLPPSSSGESWGKDGTCPKLSSHAEPSLSYAPGSGPARPLLLHTVRDSNGQLTLPSLSIQLQSSTGDAEGRPLLSDLIDSKTEGPSLASLQSLDSSEWSDSGCDDSTVHTPTQPYCNTHYFQSQPVVPDFNQGCRNTPSTDAMFEAGYKQNWMHAILLGTASKTRCEYRRTNYPWTCAGLKKEDKCEEEEDRREEERSKEFLLGGWEGKKLQPVKINYKVGSWCNLSHTDNSSVLNSLSAVVK